MRISDWSSDVCSSDLATMLIQTQGLNILTDPVWSDVAGPFGRIGPRRVAAPGVALDDLPPIDLVLVSHNHYDHLDLATLEKLWRRDRPRVITSLRSEEHTSELQSLMRISYAVFCLKKKK